MTVIFRIVISAIVIVATFYFLYWVPFAFIHIPWGIAAFLSYAGAMAAGWFAWTRTASVNPTLTRSIGYWALVVGAIGFIGGFFGPMIIVRESASMLAEIPRMIGREPASNRTSSRCSGNRRSGARMFINQIAAARSP